MALARLLSQDKLQAQTPLGFIFEAGLWTLKRLAWEFCGSRADRVGN